MFAGDIEADAIRTLAIHTRAIAFPEFSTIAPPSLFRCVHFTLRLRQLSHACGSLLCLDPFLGGPLSSDEDMSRLWIAQEWKRAMALRNAASLRWLQETEAVRGWTPGACASDTSGPSLRR